MFRCNLAQPTPAPLSRAWSLPVCLLLICLQLAPVAGTAQATSCLDLQGQWPYGPTRAMALSGSTVFFSSGGALLAMDLSNPAIPNLLGMVEIGDPIWGVEVAGSLAIVTDAWDSVYVVDVTDPAAMAVLGSFTTPGNLEQPNGVAVVGSYAFVATRSVGLYVLDLSDPTSPALAATYSIPGADFVFDVDVDVDVDGDYAYVAASAQGLRVVDVSNPLSPSEVGSHPTATEARDVVVEGSTAYVADGSTPTAPTEILKAAYAHYTKGVTVSGDRALIANGDRGLAVIRLSGPNAPRRVGTLDHAGDAVDVVLNGDYAYIAARGTDIVVAEFISPATPTEVATLDLAGSITYDLAHDEAGQLLYAGNGGGGMRVLDVSTPSSPVEIGSFVPAGNAVTFVDVEGDLAVAVGGSSGWVVDVSNPAAPAQLGTFTLPQTALEVVIDNGLFYVADYVAGLLIWSLADPANPVQIGEFSPFPLAANGVAVHGDRAYVAGDTYYGLLEEDISDPTNPVQVGSYDTPGSGQRVAYADGRIYVADYDAGLTILGCSPELFADGFESGDTTAWDSTVP